MFNQTFDLSDILRIFFLTFLELLLSADNAIVLGLLVSHLPEKSRAKALYIGVFSAFFLRAFALIGLAFFLKYQWLQLLGAAYLIYLSIHHFIKKRKKLIFPGEYSFWKTVIFIELFDLAFALDSIIAGIAFISSNTSGLLFESKLWIVYTGGILGLLGIRYASNLFSKLIHQFPRLETTAFIMVGLIGLKLAYSVLPHPPVSLEPFFWMILVLLFILGLTKRVKK